MLWQSGAFRATRPSTDRVMDSMDLEREKGITILAKNTAVRYRRHATSPSTSSTRPGTPTSAARWSAGCRWSTACCCSWTPARARCRRPGSCCARRCSAELPVVLVVNKVDRPDARIDEVVDETYELFLDLDADETQIEFPIVYCSAQGGPARSRSRPTARCRAGPGAAVRDAPRTIPAAVVRRRRTAAGARDEPGRVAVPRPARAVPGARRARSARARPVAWCRADGTVERVKITELLMTEALDRVPVERPGRATSSRSPASRRSPSARPWPTRRPAAAAPSSRSTSRRSR